MPPSGNGPPPDTARHHRESSASVRLHAQKLRRALDSDRLDDAVRIAADVAAELRSPSAAELSPKAYYDVYLSVIAELRLLEMYVMESARRGAPVLELYERVQETPLVLPRLYLLVTTGSVYVKSLQAPAKDVLRDLVEMCAGVQHPQRGLFLRAYLAQMMKDKLPGDEGEGGGVQDSIDFVIRNFTEMNRLWVRMQHDCSPREMELREKERLELRLLVGSNIATLSRLVGGSLQLYKKNVLPAVLDQIVICNDAIAQEYLADCVAQVFPDEFQLETLGEFLQTCGKLVKGVNMRTILVSIIDRLKKYAASSPEAADAARNAQAFEKFKKQLPGVVRKQGASLVLHDRLRIYLSLMSFVLEAEPDRLDYADCVLGFCVRDMDKFQGVEQNETDGLAPRPGRWAPDGRPATHTPLSADDEGLTVRILTMPLDAFRSVGSVLRLENYVILQSMLGYDNQRELAARLLLSPKGYVACIDDVETLLKLFRYVAPLVQERGASDEQPNGELHERFDAGGLTHHHEYLLALIPQSHSSMTGTIQQNGTMVEETVGKDGTEDVEFEKNQELVARIVYLLDDRDVHRTLNLYKVLRQQLVKGGEKRLPITMPSLILACLRLALRYRESGETLESILSFAGECVSVLPERWALLCLRLRLHVAGTAAALGKCAEHFVYDNVSAAFVHYEEDITSSKEQHVALELIIVGLRQTRSALSVESFDALASRAVKHAARTLTKSDQCVLLCLCAQLYGEEERAKECLEMGLAAGRGCVNGAERTLLMLDWARAAASIQEREGWELGLQSVLAEVRMVLGSRAARGAALGKVVSGRYQRLLQHLRVAQGFAGLDFSEL